MRSLIDRVAAARIGQTMNFYRDGEGAARRHDRLAAAFAAGLRTLAELMP